MDNRSFKIDLEKRTLQFGTEIVKFCVYLRKSTLPDALLTQLLKSGTSIGANYREANRAESKKDFVHKIAIVEKEASETCYWLDLINSIDMLQSDIIENLNRLMQESKELLALFTSISRNTKKGMK